MYKIKILSLLLCFALLISIFAPGAFVLQAKAAGTTGDSGTTAAGIEVNKTAKIDKDGNYTITLEAYATGARVISSAPKPTDIVLVLDQSGSMDWCIVCGQEMDGYNDYHYTYSPVDKISNNKNYYIKSDSSYQKVTYCSGTHYFIGSYPCSGGEGWYTSEWSTDHTQNSKITPKTSENPDGTQFYEVELEACKSRLSALKEAVTTFTESVKAKAAGPDGKIETTSDNVNHRIAVVGFASGKSNSYGNTELLSIKGTNSGSVGVRYDNIRNQNLKDVLQDMSTVAGCTMVDNAIGALTASGATQTNLGVDMAQRILYENPVQSDERNRVVIVFTDGSPTSSNGFELDVARDAISNANLIKASGATVYSVGVFSGADATSSGTKPSGDLSQNSSSLESASNWFMQTLSSNNGTPKNPSYYLSAGNSDSLNDIFKNLSEQIEGGSSTTLGRETVIKDIVAPAFDMPKNPSDIKVYTAASNGSTTNWNNRVEFKEGAVTPDTENSTISVSGFSFKDNWCGTETKNGEVTFHDGKKLIIEFTVTPKAGFLGGNNVYTNTSAGVYESASAAEPVVTFPWPQVNVPIKEVTVTAADKNVYLLGDLTADQIKNGATVKCGDVELKLNESNYGLEKWQTEYVDIAVEIKGKDGNVLTDLTDLTELKDDTIYTITATVKPKAGLDGKDADGTPNSMDGKIGEKGANIFVFKPELTYKDSEVYYGGTAPTNFSENKTSEVWKHGETVANPDTMIGTAPELAISYTPENDKIESGKVNTKQDIGVDVTVKIGTTDVTHNTKFQHTDCNDKTCTLPEGKEFLLHVKTCQLTITKQGGASGEPYVFTVVKKDGTVYSEVTIVGNNSETIYELPVGTYTIKEDTGWSWRYPSPTYSVNSVALSKDKTSATITCTNSNSMPYWLNGYSAVVENVYGTAKK